MTTFVLVHGAWHGAWCWKKVVPLLEQKGGRVICPDLPGHGNKGIPLSTVTLAGYVEAICEILRDQSEPVVLVAHSMGGIPVSQAAEYYPEKIKCLLYISAFMLRNGETLLQHAETDDDAMVKANLIPSADGKSVTLRSEAINEIFYNDCSIEDAEWAKSLLVPQAWEPFAAPIVISEENYGSITRNYVICTWDNTNSPSLQRKFCQALPCEKVTELASGHSPFLSQANLLTECILNV